MLLPQFFYVYIIGKKNGQIFIKYFFYVWLQYLAYLYYLIYVCA